jgi:hypothetical protein
VKDLFHVFEQYGPSARLCLDLAGDKRRIELYDFELRSQLSACASVVKAAESYRFSENSTNLKRPESFLLMIPSALSRLPLVAITSRPLLLSMGTNRELYQLLYSRAETRERALDLWEAVLKARFTGSSFYCSYTPINSSSSEQGLKFDTIQQPLSSLPVGTYPDEAGIYSCDGLGIQTCRAVSYRGACRHYYDQKEPLTLLRICRDGKALIHTEDLELLAQRLPDHILPWNLIFIVPPGMKDSVSLQPFVGDGDWESEGKIVQCVAAVNV